MMKNISIILIGIAMSFSLFPFHFAILPTVNSKMIMAVIGVVFVVFQMIKSRSLGISKDFIKICICAAVFSLICLHSVNYNNTPDYSYAIYFISMLVWLSAAYAVCQMIQWVHGAISFRLLTNYLVGVCVFQCISALLIHFSLPVKTIVDSCVSQGADFYDDIGRIYGIGAALDVAGTRFASVLIILMVLICVDEQVRENKKRLLTYIIAFVIIAVVGNIIARTTILGLLIAFLYFVYTIRIIQIKIPRSNLLLWKWLLGILGIMILLIVLLYNYNEDIYHLLRFGFEGFFNWVEYGKWETHSTEQLKTMWKWPESDKTWIFGDGYFNAPSTFDPEHHGKNGFYMYTDVGFLRFIFYCGIPGLFAFCFFLFYMARFCCRKYMNEKNAFYILFILQLIIFSKVATDIFIIYAFFYAATIQDRSLPTYYLNS